MQNSLSESSRQSNIDARLFEAIEADYIKAEQSLAHFFKASWDVIEPRTPLKWNWHFDYICEHLEAIELGQINRLIINVPPRSAKSNLVTVAYPAWVWIKHAERRFMAASYSGSLSTKHSVDRRNLIESDWYQMGYGSRFAMSTDQNVKTEFMNDKRGHMIATSMTGTATGKGCNRLIIDDPINPKEAESETERDSCNSNYDSTFPSRLDDKKKDAIIITMQRLHEDDLVGHVKEQDAWVHVKLPAEAQESQKLIFPISKRIVERNKGDLLHEEREGARELLAMKKALGSRMYSAQYNQTPSSAEGNIIKLQWLEPHYYDVLPEIEEKGIFVDLSFEEGEENSFTVVECWGRTGSNIYLIDQIRAQMGFPDQKVAMQTMITRHPDAYIKEVEKKANGAAIIDTLESQVPGLVGISPKTSKVARVHAVSPLYEAGNVHYPNPKIHNWAQTNIDEMLSFPNGKFNDTVDVASMAVMRLGKVAMSIQRFEALNKL